MGAERDGGKRGDEVVREGKIMTRNMSKKCITVPAFSAIEAFPGILMRTALRTCSLCILRRLNALRDLLSTSRWRKGGQ